MIKLNKVSKTYGNGAIGLSELTLDVEKGEFVFLVGSTGSGKTTMLKLLTREILPTEGTIVVSDFDIVKLPHHKIPNLRKKIGVIFQDLKLLMDRTIFENVILPLEVAGMKADEARKKTEEIMSQVGIAMHKDKFPIQLSGGELQRVAIARALVLSPDIVLADEPTGNLDPKTSKEIVETLIEVNNKGTTVVMVTHNAEIVNNLSKRVVALDKGRLIRDEKKGKYGSS
ncbi:MAG: ATP-binding cassette domain-containing protein [Candidatus Levyibacteriota bacterium]